MGLNQYYILNAMMTPTPVSDDEYWAWQEKLPKKNKSILAYIIKQEDIGTCSISTIFNGCDNIGHNSDGEPFLFETIIIGGRYHKLIKRYISYDEALIAHEQFSFNLTLDEKDTEVVYD